MSPKTVISVFEHDRLTIDDEHFKKRHLDALLKLNEAHNFDYFDPIRDGIKFKQYVGVIQVDNLTIEILPKADREGDTDAWRNVLLQMLRKCHKLKASTYGDAYVKRINLNLLEIYFSIFLNEVSGIMRQGLIKKYRKETGSMNSLKGKIIFSSHLKESIVHKERFYTEHQIYDKNHQLHQILKAALCIVEQFTRGTHLFDHCKRIIFDFPEVSEINITKKLLDSFHITRKTSPYEKAFDIARLILLNYSPDISSGSEKMLALLFDMNKLWEEYVTITLREELKNSNVTIIAQDSKPFWGDNSLNPDIIIENGNEVIIVDTKWKTPGHSSASNHDLRQMYAYNRFWNANRAVLLYPGDTNSNDFKWFLNANDLVSHSCKMAFVSVLDGSGGMNKEFAGDLMSAFKIEKLVS